MTKKIAIGIAALGLAIGGVVFANTSYVNSIRNADSGQSIAHARTAFYDPGDEIMIGEEEVPL